MNRFGKLVLSVATTIVCVAGVAAPTFAATRGTASTVGDLLVGIATLKQLPAADATMAGAALRSAGYDLPRLSPTKSLTEGDVAAVANALGLRIASSNPTRSFSTSQMNQFLMTVRSDLQTDKARLSAFRTASESSRSGSSSGKKKPRSKSPRNPDRESTPLTR